MALCKNNLTLVETEKTTDCDVVVDRLEDTLYDLGDCFDAVLNEKRTKMSVAGSIFNFGVSLTKLTLNVAGCAIKHSPKAVVAVASLKREIVTNIESEYSQYQKELKEEALNKKIKQLQLKA